MVLIIIKNTYVSYEIVFTYLKWFYSYKIIIL